MNIVGVVKWHTVSLTDVLQISWAFLTVLDCCFFVFCYLSYPSLVEPQSANFTLQNRSADAPAYVTYFLLGNRLDIYI